MARDKKIYLNPTAYNRAIKSQREAYKIQKDEFVQYLAEIESRKRGSTPEEARKYVELLHSDLINSYSNIHAVLDFQRIDNILASSKYRIYSNTDKIKWPSRYQEPPNAKEAYRNVFENAIYSLTGKTGTPQQLLWNTEKLNRELTYAFNEKARSFRHIGDILDSYEYFKKNRDVVVLDLETFGGTNQYGRRQVDRITEFAFNFYRHKPGEAEPEVTRYHGFVGIDRNSREFSYYESLIQKGDYASLPEKDRVALLNLARIGHKETEIVEDPDMPGRFIVKKWFEGTEEIINRENLSRGLKRATEIGDKQKRHLYGGLMAWEKDLADALIEMQKGKMSVAGHNVARADLVWLNEFLAQHASQNMKNYLAQHGLTTLQINPVRVLDTLSIPQQALSDPKTLMLLYGQDASVLKEEGLTPFSLKALAKRFLPDAYEKSGAHSAVVDAHINYRLLTEAKIGDDNLYDRLMEIIREQYKNIGKTTLKPGRKQLFYATSGYQPEDLLGFRMDALTGKIRTTDGYEIAQDLTVKEGLGERLVKKGVSYTIDDIVKITPNQSFIEQMKNVYPALATNELIAVKMSPVVGSMAGTNPYADEVLKGKESFWQIGTEESIKSWFAQNLYQYAEMDESGAWKALPGAEEALARYDLVADEGKAVLKRYAGKDFVQDVIQEGTELYYGDTAARTLRNRKLSQYEALLKFSDAVNQMAASDPSNDALVIKKSRAIRRMLDEAQKMAKTVASGKELTFADQNDPAMMLLDIFGYVDYRTGQRTVHPRTVDNAIVLLQYIESIGPEVRMLVEEVKKKGQGYSKAQQNFMFKRGLEAIIAKAQEKLGQDIDTKGTFIRGLEKDYFEIDLSGFYKGTGTAIGKTVAESGSDHIVRINLKSGGGYDLISQLMGEKESSLEGDVPVMKELARFVDYVQREHGLLKDVYGDMPASDFISKNTPATFANRIVESLRKHREEHPLSGYLTAPRAHYVLEESDLAGLLSKEELFDIFERELRPDAFREIAKHPEGIRAQAVELVDKFLMDPFDEAKLKKYGYTDNQLWIMRKSYDVRRQDYIEMMENFLKGMRHLGSGAQLFADEVTGELGFIYNDRYFDLSMIPRDRLRDGMFYIEMGRSKYAPQLYLDVARKYGRQEVLPSDIRLRSSIGMAMDDSYYYSLERMVKTAIEERNQSLDDVVMRWTNAIASNIREGSTVHMLDEQDIKSQFELNLSRVVDNLPYMENWLKETNFSNMSEDLKERFMERIKREGFAYDAMTDLDRSLWSLAQDDVINMLAERSGNESIKRMARQMTGRQKASSRERGNVRIDPAQYEFEYFNKASRDIENQIRYLAYREGQARRALGELGDASVADSILIDSPIRTRLGHAMTARAYEGMNEATRKEFMTTRAALTSKGFAQKIKKFVDERALSEAEERALEIVMLQGNITEGGAVAAAEIADTVIQNYDRQKVSVQREFLLQFADNTQTIEEVKKFSQIIPEFVITEDGKIDFVYKKGRYVRAGERILSEVGYGGHVTDIGAKYSGALRFGFFTKGGDILATEQEVIEHVQRYAQEKGIKIRSVQDFMRIAEQFYDASVYVERLTVPNYRKLMEDRLEKHMTSFLYMGLGESVSREALTTGGRYTSELIENGAKINQLLERLGLGHLRGKVLAREFLEELVTPVNTESSIIAQLSTKELTSGEHQKAIKEIFGSSEAAREALLRERYLPSQILREITGGANMVLINKEKSHDNIMSVLNTGMNQMYLNEYRRLRKEGLSPEEAERRALQYLQGKMAPVFKRGDGGSLISLDESGLIVLDEVDFFRGDRIDFNAAKAVMKEELKEEYDKLFEEGAVTPHWYAVMQDYTGTSGAGILPRRRRELLTPEERIALDMAKGAKITDREISMLEITRYDQKMIDELYEKMDQDTFRRVFEHVVDFEDGRPVLKAGMEGVPVLGDFTDEVRRQLFAKPGETYAVTRAQYKELERQVREGGLQHLDLTEFRVVEDKYARALENLQQAARGHVGFDTFMELYSAAENLTAIEFNARRIEDPAYMLKRGFVLKRIGEIDLPEGEDAKYLLRQSPNSIFGQSVLIDIQDDVITEDILRQTKTGRYLAIGELPVGILNEETVLPGPYIRLKEIVRLRSELKHAQSIGLSQEEIERKKQRLVSAIDAVNQEISKYVTGKEGVIARAAEVRLEAAALGKSSLMSVDDMLEAGLEPKFLQNMMFGGKSIFDLHKSGTLVDFKIMSEEAFEKMGILTQEYAESLGLSGIDDLKQVLRTEGIMAYSHRHPTVYRGAIRPVQLYLAPEGSGISGNMAIEYAAGAIRAKMDSDGDAPKSLITRFSDLNGRMWDSLQMKYAMERGRNVDDAVIKAFKNQEAMMYYNALIENPHFVKILEEETAKLREWDMQIADRVREIRNLLDGQALPDIAGQIPSAKRAELLEKYEQLRKKSVDLYLADHPDLFNLSPEKRKAAVLEALDAKLDTHVDYLRRALQEVSPELREEYALAGDYHIRQMTHLAEQISKYKRASAGEINLPLYQARKVRDLAYNVLSSEEHKILEHAYEAIEEAYLSPKHSEMMVVSNVLVMDEFSRAFRAATGSPMRGDRAGTELLEDWLRKNLPGRFDIKQVAPDMSEDEIYSLIPKLIQKTFSSIENIQEYNRFLSALGTIKEGINPERIRDAFVVPEESRMLVSDVLKGIKAIDPDSMITFTKLRQRADIGFEGYKSVWETPTDKALLEGTQEALGRLTQSMRSVRLTGRHLAFGALGLAGAVMLAGFVGGNPASPHGSEAQQAQEAESGYQYPVSLADGNLVIQPSRQGYIINISAQSPRERDYIIQAVQQAMASSQPTTVNVSMNIADSSGNISDRDIERMLEGAFY